MTPRDVLDLILRRSAPPRFAYAPNYWQWFAHHRSHGSLPEEVRDVPDQLDLIRRLGLDVFSRNVYGDPTRYWFGGLAEEVWEDVEVEVARREEGGGLVTEKIYRTRRGTLTERLRYVRSESTLVQEKFLFDDFDAQRDAFEAFVRGRRWRFDRARYEEWRDRVGVDGFVNAGELFSPLKMLHLAARADQSVFLLADHPEFCREAMAAHEAGQLDLVRQMLAAGVRSMISMDNLDAAFHPPRYVERCSAGFYERAARLCREAGAAFFIHACGRQRALLPVVASLGVDGLEGVAFPTLGDVELDEAMRLSGDRLILTGGISALEFGRLQARDDIRAYVRGLLGRMKPFAHRFILSASCNTPVTAPWESILHFRDAWREYSGIQGP